MTVKLIHGSQFGDHNVGRFRVSVSSAESSLLNLSGGGLPTEIVDLIRKPRADRSDGDSQKLLDYVRQSVTTPASQAAQQVAAAEKAINDFREELPTTMVMKETTRAMRLF